MDLFDLKHLVKQCKQMFFHSDSRKNYINTDDFFYFLHIPKAGGTSLRYALYEQFEPYDVYPNLVDYYLKQRASYITLDNFRNSYFKYLKPNVKLLIGHYGLFPLQIEGLSPKVFTVLRHPVSRLISGINYHSRKGRRFYGLSNREVLMKSRGLECRRLAHNIGYDLTYYSEEKATKSFENIDVVGILEHLESSFSLLNRSFSWDLQVPIHTNKSVVKRGFSSSEFLEMEKMCAVDIELYNLGKTRFFADCNSYGIDIF